MVATSSLLCSSSWWHVCQQVTPSHYFSRWDCGVKDQLLKPAVWLSGFRPFTGSSGGGIQADMRKQSERQWPGSWHVDAFWGGSSSTPSAAFLSQVLLILFKQQLSFLMSDGMTVRIKLLLVSQTCFRRLLWKITSSPKSGPNEVFFLAAVSANTCSTVGLLL